MSLRRYLEISTHKDFRQMMKDAGLEPNQGTASGDLEFLDAKKKFYDKFSKSVNNDLILKDKTYTSAGSNASRICLCHNGHFFNCSTSVVNHSYLMNVAFFDYQFPELRYKLNDLDWWSWWADIESLGSFICLTYNENRILNKIGLSESYHGEDDVIEFLKTNTSILNHYTQLVKQKFSKDLVLDVIQTY